MNKAKIIKAKFIGYDPENGRPINACENGWGVYVYYGWSFEESRLDECAKYSYPDAEEDYLRWEIDEIDLEMASFALDRRRRELKDDGIISHGLCTLHLGRDPLYGEDVWITKDYWANDSTVSFESVHIGDYDDRIIWEGSSDDYDLSHDFSFKEALYFSDEIKNYIIANRRKSLVDHEKDDGNTITEHLVGNEPNNNLPVFAIEGRYVDILQIGADYSSGFEPVLISLPPDGSINTISLNEALSLFKQADLYPIRKGISRSTDNNLYTIHDVEQRTRKWYELREGKVTGSQAILLKTHSLSYVLERSYDQNTGYTSESAQRGLDLERVGIGLFAKKTGLDVEFVGFVTSNIYPAAGCSPDGVIFDRSSGKKRIKTIIEHKAFSKPHHMSCHNSIDDKVMWQIQYNMFVTGADDAYLILYNPDMENRDDQLFIHKIEPNAEIYDIFKQKLK